MTKTIDFDAEIVDQKGKPMPLGDGEEGNTTLRHVSQQALIAQFSDEQNLASAIKVKRYRIFQKIGDSGKIDLKSDEIVSLKTCIGKAYGPLIVGQALDLIEPDDSTPAREKAETTEEANG